MNSRAYPDRPFIGIGAVIVDPAAPRGSVEARVVLIRRRFDPLKGEWSLPGGAVEIGETLESCVVREVGEETGLHVDVGPVIEVFDRIVHDDTGRVQYHYVLVDYLCWKTGGALRPGSDADAAAWADASELPAYHLTEKALAVIHRGLELARDAPRAVRSPAPAGAARSFGEDRGGG